MPPSSTVVNTPFRAWSRRETQRSAGVWSRGRVVMVMGCPSSVCLAYDVRLPHSTASRLGLAGRQATLRKRQRTPAGAWSPSGGGPAPGPAPSSAGGRVLDHPRRGSADLLHDRGALTGGE